MYLHIGQEIEQFKILEELGFGGMGVVYKAIDTSIGRLVALKVILPQFISDERTRLRFHREATLLAKLDSEHIVRIHTYREIEQLTFIAMEFVDGGNLGRLIAEGRMSPDRAVDMTRQILVGLDRAHAVGVIHRDVKPANVMIAGDGKVKLTDFGLARASEFSIEITRSSMAVGTPAYMSPEQLQGMEVDARTDLWSTGIILYEMLVGVRPFTSIYDQALPYEILNTDPSFPDDILSQLPSGLESFVLKSLEKDRDKRYQSAAEMLAGLESIALKPAVEGAGTIEDKRRRRLWRRIGVAGGAVAVAAAGYLLLPSGSEQPAREGDESISTKTGLSAASETHLDSVETGKTTPQAEAVDPQAGIATDTGTDSPSVAELTDTADAHASTLSTLNLKVIPGGMVSIDEGPAQQSGRFSLKPGEHAIRCQSPDDGEIQHTIFLSADEQKSVTCYFEAQVNINSTPVWGTVWINGKKTEWTTPAQIVLTPGKYSIVVRRFGYSSSTSPESIEVTPSFDVQQRHTLAFKLTKL